jgi:Rps23 Pro-64 3,4-dihydroxylase Tpa1-like proline 4-hydroxylase
VSTKTLKAKLEAGGSEGRLDMPKLVEQLTENEKQIEGQLRERFSEEQFCAYFLTKTIRSLYQFDNEFIQQWYEETFNRKSERPEDARRELVQAYTRMLMVENKYRFHLDYWLRQYQGTIVKEMEDFFGANLANRRLHKTASSLTPCHLLLYPWRSASQAEFCVKLFP